MTLHAVLWLIFFSATALTVLLGLILTYHWFRFAMNSGVSILATGVFVVVCAALLLALSSVIFITPV